jgi:catechol 2,3-dioxygenase-like lactoylglutathione lyase family enzyme
MTTETNLASHKIVAFVPISDPIKAKSFYRDTLGLTLISEELPFALVFDLNGIMLRLSIIGKPSPAPWAVLGWEVPDIVASARSLGGRGVRFERYEGMEQDENGVWRSPTRARVAWFKDPEGNVLSLSEHPER